MSFFFFFVFRTEKNLVRIIGGKGERKGLVKNHLVDRGKIEN